MKHRSLLAFLLSGVLAASSHAQGDLFVTSWFTHSVLRYDGATGAFLGVFASGGGLVNPVGLTFGPDGDLFVASAGTSQVLRYDGTSGAFLGLFAQGGGLSGARQVGFGPDGNLYVASSLSNTVLRYDGVSGAFQGVAALGGTLRGPTSFTFAADGTLYVVSVTNDRVKRYDPATGAFLGNFVVSNVNGPHDLTFGPDGLLYVSNAFATRIARFDPVSGAFVDDFVSDPALINALGLTWDANGDLLVVNQGASEVRRYDRRTGAFEASLVASGAGGLSAALFCVFRPRPGGPVLDTFPNRANRQNWVHVSGARPGSVLELRISARPAALMLLDCPAGTQVLPYSLARVVADESGQALFSAFVPGTMAGENFLLQPADIAACFAGPVIGMRF